MAKVGYAIMAVILLSGVFSFWHGYRVERTRDGDLKTDVCATVGSILKRASQANSSVGVIGLPGGSGAMGSCTYVPLCSPDALCPPGVVGPGEEAQTQRDHGTVQAEELVPAQELLLRPAPHSGGKLHGRVGEELLENSRRPIFVCVGDGGALVQVLNPQL